MSVSPGDLGTAAETSRNTGGGWKGAPESALGWPPGGRSAAVVVDVTAMPSGVPPSAAAAAAAEDRRLIIHSGHRILVVASLKYIFKYKVIYNCSQ